MGAGAPAHRRGFRRRSGLGSSRGAPRGRRAERRPDLRRWGSPLGGAGGRGPRPGLRRLGPPCAAARTWRWRLPSAQLSAARVADAPTRGRGWRLDSARVVGHPTQPTPRVTVARRPCCATAVVSGCAGPPRARCTDRRALREGHAGARRRAARGVRGSDGSAARARSSRGDSRGSGDAHGPGPRRDRALSATQATRRRPRRQRRSDGRSARATRSLSGGRARAAAEPPAR